MNQPNRHNEQFLDPDSSGNQQSPFPTWYPPQSFSSFSIPSSSASQSQQTPQQQMPSLQHQLYLLYQENLSILMQLQNRQCLPSTQQPSIETNNSIVNNPSQTIQEQTTNSSVPSLSAPHPQQQMSSLQNQLYLLCQENLSFLMQLQNRQRLPSIQTNNSIVNNPSQTLQEQATNNHTSSLASNGQLSTGFNSLSDDVLYLILQFFSTKSYIIFGILDKRCRQIFLAKNQPKQTYLYGHAPLKTIIKELTPVRTNTVFFRHPSGIAKSVVYFNRYDMLDLILENQSNHSNTTKLLLLYTCETAAREKRLNILSVIFNNSNEAILKYLKRKDHYSMATYASKNGHVEMLRFLKEKCCSINGFKCVNEAARFGRLHVIQWLTANGYPLNESMATYASKNGHVEVLRFLKEKCCSINGFKCVNEAARFGRLNVIQWLTANGYPLDKYVLSSAVYSGNLQLLQWLIDNGCTWTYGTFASAALKGNVAVFQWLRDNGCPWDEDTFKNAVTSGNVAALEWLHSRGCPWKKDIFPWALTRENRNVINVSSWLLRNGCHWGTDIFEYAWQQHKTELWYGKIELNTLKWLKVQGYHFTENSFKYAVYYASENYELNILDWLLEIGCPWNNNTIFETYIECDVEDWLSRNGFGHTIVVDEENDDDFF